MLGNKRFFNRYRIKNKYKKNNKKVNDKAANFILKLGILIIFIQIFILLLFLF